MKEYYRVHANIYLDRICNNIKRTKDIIKSGTKIMAIVKADAYGHGAVAVAKALYPLVDAYGVAVIEEAIELRNAGIDKEILILGYTPQPYVKELVKWDITATVYSLEMAQWMAKEALKQGENAKVHIKLDTGMSRIGFALTKENVQVIKEISELRGITITGCFTHFARADEKDLSFTKLQLKRFEDYVKEIEKAGVQIPLKHVSNSAGIMEMPEANLDMVRSGISTYGLYPSSEVEKERLYLEPAMEIKAYVSYVKEVEAGIGISYNSTFVTEKKTKVATIPVGYGDGYPRALSSKGSVLIHGKHAKILGRVCMDQFMVDVTDIPNVKVGDCATLVGKDGDAIITVEELSAMAYSFNYEFICDVGKRIPRVYIVDGKKVGTSECKNVVSMQKNI